MGELELVRLHEDGENLVLAGADGSRFTLPITEALRAAVRRDRPQMEHLRAQGASSLPPRDIQRRLRAGSTIEEVAEEAGVPIEQVRRYAGPVVSEQEYVISRARATAVGTGPEPPTLGDVAVERLTARSVDLDTLAWTATRTPGSPWVIAAAFTVGDKPRTARWTYDVTTRLLEALDDEARWLSEDGGADEPVRRGHGAYDPATGPRRPLAAVTPVSGGANDAGPSADPVAPGGGPDPAAEPAPPPDPTATLLDSLRRRRGVRATRPSEPGPAQSPGAAPGATPATEPDTPAAPGGPVASDDDTFDGFGPQHAFDLDALDDDPERPGDAPAEPSTSPPGATVLTLPRPRRTGAPAAASAPDEAGPSVVGAGSTGGEPPGTETHSDADAVSTDTHGPGSAGDAGSAGGARGARGPGGAGADGPPGDARPPAGGPGSTRRSGGDEHAGAPGSARAGSGPVTAATASRPVDGAGTASSSTDEAAGPAREARRGGRKGRAKVPSWDEIVFGAKPEH